MHYLEQKGVREHDSVSIRPRQERVAQLPTCVELIVNPR